MCEEHEEEIAERGAGHNWRERTQGYSTTSTSYERPRGPRISHEKAVGCSSDSNCPFNYFCNGNGMCEEHEEEIAERGAGHDWRERTQGYSTTSTSYERPRGPRISHEKAVGERGAGHDWRERTQGYSTTSTGYERPRGPRISHN